jgi:homoserine O-acetyltransferase
MPVPDTVETPLAAADPSAREHVIVVPGPLELHHGIALPEVALAWRMTGAAHLPVVVALGGISAGRGVWDAGDRWWSGVVGPGRALDSDRFRILGIDYLGGSADTSGPRPGAAPFPPVSSFDQAALLDLLRRHLGIERYAAIVGASYGGMVALAFAARYPAALERIVVISASHRAHPLSTAWRSVQRAIVRQSLEQHDGPAGLKLARALAMATYRSPREFEERFAAPPEFDGELGRYVFPVERYLFARGDAYAQRYVPESFLRLSESIDLHDVDPAGIHTPATLVAVREDQLVPLVDMRTLARQLGGPNALIEISSLYGHDAFLKENDMLKPVLDAALAHGARA